jgi:hypothetical protein
MHRPYGSVWNIVRLLRAMTSASSADLPSRAEGVRGAPLRGRADGLRLAQAACAVGLLFAAVSVYWCLGGTWLLDTIGGSLEEQARDGNTGAAWAAAAAKTIAAVLPLMALRLERRTAWGRGAWILAWVQAAFLTLYGLLFTAVGLLVQAGAVRASAGADRYAMAWHTYLWDPWFLVWGLLVVAALLRSRHRLRRS